MIGAKTITNAILLVVGQILISVGVVLAMDNENIGMFLALLGISMMTLYVNYTRRGI